MKIFSRKINKKIGNFKKLRRDTNSNLNMFIVCTAVVMIWRGIWDLLDIYLFPEQRRLSCIICIILGVLILLADDGKLDEL